MLAIWLTPTQFGYWASALSVISILAGIVNFGEVNAFLARSGMSFARLRSRTRRLNALLALSCVPVVALYVAAGRYEVALLAAIVAASIPVQGEADVLYASCKTTVWKERPSTSRWSDADCWFSAS